jgi:hypothetical protein
MAKSVAGVLVLAVMAVVVRNPKRVVLAGLATVALACPWFLYNYAAHRDWFVADMTYQIVTVGTLAHQTSQENHVLFYLLRIVVSDTLPLLLTISAVPALGAALRRRESAAILAGAYVVIYFAALMVFRFHSQQYLCWFAPSLILAAGLYSPLLNGRPALGMLAVIGAVFVIKTANPESSFGLDFRSGSTLATSEPLSRYCGQHRATTLHVIGVDDEFYSAVLPLERVRYAWLDPANVVSHEHPHLSHLGILVSSDELEQLEAKLPVYQQRLREWGMESTEALQTGVSATSVEALQKMVRDHPDRDFLVARTILPEPEKVTTHKIAASGNDFVLLESNTTPREHTPEWTCAM